MKRILLLLCLAVPAILSLQSFYEKPAIQEVQADSICFTRDILPIFNSNCAQAGCHDAATHKDGYTTTSYSGVMKGIKANNVTGSPFYRQINLKTMPQYPFLPIPDSLKNRIASWINAGAPNSTCASEVCDTSAVTYLRDIKPILQVNCVGCHQSSLAGGGVTLDDDEKNDILKERIYNTAAHISAYKQMPPNIAKLNNCQIAKLRIWAFGIVSSTSDDDQFLSSSLQVIHKSSDHDVVRFNLHHESVATLSIYTAEGRLVMSIPANTYQAGSNEISINSSSLNSGLYIARLVAGNEHRSQKFIR